MKECTVTSGFLIEKSFGRMCREYLGMLEFRTDLMGRGGYSQPSREISPDEMPKQYKGLHREPMQGWVESLRGSGVIEPTDRELAASLFLENLNADGKACDDFVFALDDAIELVDMIVPPIEREIIWARRMDAGDVPPHEMVLLGYDVTAFYPPESNSAIAECMFFITWIDYDKERVRFREYHAKLNRWGLFNTVGDAEQYLEAYLSALPADADEQCYGHCIAEVRRPVVE